MSTAGISATRRPVPTFLPTSWSWWTRPRAVAWGGIVYVGGTASDGSTVVDEWDSATTIRTRHHIADIIGTTMDDHNNPAIVLEPGQPPVVFYAGHNDEYVLRYRVGTSDFVAGADLGDFGPVRSIDFGSGQVTYASAFVHGTDLQVFCRLRSATKHWGWAKSTDWGETWTTQELFSCPDTLYMATNLVGDTIRCALSTHPVSQSPPNQNVYYAELDLLTGAVTAGGSTLGNLDGTNLPISWDTCELVGSPPVGEVTWVYDVSDGPDPEVAWSSFDPASIPATSMYRYSTRAGGSWATQPVVAAGNVWPWIAELYLGGAQFPKDSAGGVIVTSREDAGAWYVEEHTTADDGANWTTTSELTETKPTQAVVRAWPVEQRDATPPPFDIAAEWADNSRHFTTFGWGNVGGSLRPAPSA